MLKDWIRYISIAEKGCEEGFTCAGLHAVQYYKYINDLEKGKNNEVAKVADEITLFKIEELKDDCKELQKTL